MNAPTISGIERSCAVVSTALGAALLVAWLAFEFQQLHIAPAVVFPLLVGAAAGGGLPLAERLLGRRLAWGRSLATMVCCLAAVVGQEVIGYVKVQRPRDAARLSDPRLELFRDEGFAPEPTPFSSYLAAHVRDEPIWWTLDLVLTLAGGMGIVFWTGKSQIQSGVQEPPL